jgi:polysaccharide export outer membrane protein
MGKVQVTAVGTTKAIPTKKKDENNQSLKILFKIPMKIFKTRLPCQIKTIVTALLITVFFSGCYSYKNQILFQGLNDTTYPANMTQTKPVIQLGDQLGIFVYGLDEKTTAYFNLPMGGGQGGGMQMMMGGQGGGMIGYLVSEEGTIEFPKLGTLTVLGFNQEQLRDSLQVWLQPWIKTPVVNVRLMNFRVTYLTTDRAQTLLVQNNKTNIIQFLGMVSGITWTDRKDNVLVIRQIDGERQVFHVDFTTKELFNSPAYYLQPNDIVYVEPNQRKFVESNVQLISLVTSITSTISIFVLFVNSLR